MISVSRVIILGVPGVQRYIVVFVLELLNTALAPQCMVS